MLQRERVAWVWLTAMIVCMGSYFVAVATFKELRIELSFFTQIEILAAATLSMAAVVLGDRLIAWIRGRGREQEAVDERDRLIEYRSATVAYYVLMAGMILVGCIMPLDKTKTGWDVVNAAIFYIVVAEIVKQVLILRAYRRGLRV
jgi:hypothetical protein